MAIVFKLTGKEAVLDMKEFCRLKEELTYVGKYANKDTCEVICGSIIQYRNKYYTTELPGRPGISCNCRDGITTTTVELFETSDYVPEKCKPISDFLILIDVWDVKIDDEFPIASYAFDENQVAKAKDFVKCNKDVDIYFDGTIISREEFLAK